MRCYLSFSISEMWLVTALWRSMENTFCSRRKLFQSAPEPCTVNREGVKMLREAKSCRRAQKTLDWTKVCITLMVTVTQVCSGVIYRSKHIIQGGWGILRVLAILGLMQAPLCSSSKWGCTACSIAQQLMSFGKFKNHGGRTSICGRQMICLEWWWQTFDSSQS